MRMRHRLPAWLETAGGDLLRLLVPVECPGCGALDTALCAECLASLRRPARRCDHGADHLVPADDGPALPVWTSAAYRPPVDRTVIAWKDHGRRDLDPVMELTMAQLAQAVAPTFAGVLAALDEPALVLVAIPSSRAALARRGGWLTHQLAEAAAAAMCEAGVPASASRALRRLGGGRQVGRSAAQRSRLRRQTTEVYRPPAGAVVLIDDVLTTGSSLLDAERALSGLGVPVLGGLVLAATGPNRSQRNSELFDGRH